MRKIILTTFAAIALAISSAHAATLTTSYSVTSAVGSGNDHSLWIRNGLGGGIGSDFDFKPAGLFSLFDDGTATLTGTVVSQNDMNSGFKLSFNYDNTYPFEGGPQFKSENGSAAVVGQTIYRDLESGTLSGFGVLEGLNLAVSRRPANGPYATQIGPSNGKNIGANNKNKNFGMAHWLTLQIIYPEPDKNSDNVQRLFSDEYEYRCEICERYAHLNGRQADINVDLNPVPLPAPVLLMLSGLAGLFGFSRRK